MSRRLAFALGLVSAGALLVGAIALGLALGDGQ